jgi:hypothetical protein
MTNTSIETDTDARAINAAEWEPFPRMVKMR